MRKKMGGSKRAKQSLPRLWGRSLNSTTLCTALHILLNGFVTFLMNHPISGGRDRDFFFFFFFSSHTKLAPKNDWHNLWASKMAQIEALHFCYLTICFKGFRKTPQSSAREAPVTTQRASKETKQFYHFRSLVFFFLLYKQRLTAVTINHGYMQPVTYLRLSLHSRLGLPSHEPTNQLGTPHPSKQTSYVAPY